SSSASASRKNSPPWDSKAAQQLLGGHRCATGPLNLEGADRAGSAGNCQALVEDFTGRGGPLGDFCRNQLYPLAIGLEPSAGRRGEGAHLALDFVRRSVPVDPRLGLVDLGRVSRAALRLSFGRSRV